MQVLEHFNQISRWKCLTEGCNNLLDNLESRGVRKKYCTGCNHKRRLDRTRSWQKDRKKERLDRKCLFCDTPIGEKRGNAKYCSNSCWWRNNRIKNRDCLLCGNKINYIIEKCRRKYCSKECNRASHHIRGLERAGFKVKLERVS